MLHVIFAAAVILLIMGGVAFLAIRTSLTARKDEENATELQQPQASH